MSSQSETSNFPKDLKGFIDLDSDEPLTEIDYSYLIDYADDYVDHINSLIYRINPHDFVTSYMDLNDDSENVMRGEDLRKIVAHICESVSPSYCPELFLLLAIMNHNVDTFFDVFEENKLDIREKIYERFIYIMLDDKKTCHETILKMLKYNPEELWQYFSVSDWMENFQFMIEEGEMDPEVLTKLYLKHLSSSRKYFDGDLLLLVSAANQGVDIQKCLVEHVGSLLKTPKVFN